MISEGIIPDVIIYTTMIKLYGDSKRIREAEELFHQMISQGIIPTVYTYTTMIKLYGDSNRIREAEEIFHQMNSEGIIPTVITYNTMINMYAKSKKAEYISKAQKILYQDMVQKGIRRDGYSFDPMERAYNSMFRGQQLETKLNMLKIYQKSFWKKGLACYNTYFLFYRVKRQLHHKATK
jgi:pentatricopeptide repeat protein